MKLLVAVLSVVCLALAAEIWMRQGPGSAEFQRVSALTYQLTTFSNAVHDSRLKAEEEAKLAAYLQSNLTVRITELTGLSNHFEAVAAELASAQSALAAARSEAKASGSRVADLEGQKDDLQSRLKELAGSIESLNAQIAEAKRKLAAAEGDRSLLTKELTRLQSDKSELLRQFNDLAALKAQVSLLREEAAVNQRAAWMAQGVYQTAGRKGAEALIARPVSLVATGDPALNVEIREKGQPAEVPARPIPAK